MRDAAKGLLAALHGGQRDLAARQFEDVGARRWIEYRPKSRPGASLSNMDSVARKAAHRLLATALSPHAYAQAMAIIALEEVLDRREGWHRGRHSNDYWVTVFGDPGRDDAWSWRFEGHHISVTMTVVDGVVSPAPVFFGANPHRVTYDGRAVLAPLAAEEELARALVESLTPAERSLAIVSDVAPSDIRTATSAQATPVEPFGIAAARLDGRARALLDRIVRTYLDRLPAELQPDPGEVSFAWEGPVVQGGRHYYRIQGDDLLIEYDNTQEDGNHAHTVLRRPSADFGEDLLRKHLDDERDPM